MESKSAPALSPDKLRSILDAMRSSQIVLNPANKVTPKQTLSEHCGAADLTDLVTMFAATGARISEVLGIRWQDVDFTAKTVTITGKVNCFPRQGMIRESFTKTAAGLRVLPLPAFAIVMLMGRQVAASGNAHDVVFPSALGTLRDPSAVHKQWRTVRGCLKLDWVTSHTYRKTLATLLDDQGLSARVGADQLGHAQVSMTQDVYMGRKTVQRSCRCSRQDGFLMWLKDWLTIGVSLLVGLGSSGLTNWLNVRKAKADRLDAAAKEERNQKRERNRTLREYLRVLEEVSADWENHMISRRASTIQGGY
jgi:integrase